MKIVIFLSVGEMARKQQCLFFRSWLFILEETVLHRTQTYNIFRSFWLFLFFFFFLLFHFLPSNTPLKLAINNEVFVTNMRRSFELVASCFSVWRTRNENRDYFADFLLLFIIVSFFD